MKILKVIETEEKYVYVAVVEYDNGIKKHHRLNLQLEDDTPAQELRNEVLRWVSKGFDVEEYKDHGPDFDPAEEGVYGFLDFKTTVSGRTYGLIDTPAGERWVLAE